MQRLLLSLLIFLSAIGIAQAQSSLSSSDYVAFTFMALGAILTTLLIFLIIQHYAKSKEKIASDPRVPALRKHFKDSLDQGYTKKQVIDAAIKQGWPKSMIESALKSL